MSNDQIPTTETRRPWWRTLPAILTAMAAILTALSALVSALWPYGISGPQAESVTTYDSDGGLVVEVRTADVWHDERKHWDQVEVE